MVMNFSHFLLIILLIQYKMGNQAYDIIYYYWIFMHMIIFYESKQYYMNEFLIRINLILLLNLIFH